uniref:phage terminase large subunit family protein n=1 Tax=Pararhizobium sp. IMCC3301 TaxID=3067904 RepID=UPI0027408B3E|nr:phage terminase large subunit family protein [Pararhizobium sp. IMCC3301]
MALSDWVERNVYLPSSIAAHPGRMRLWPHQVAIADSIGDPNVERVSVLKSVRIGYTQLLTAAIGHYAVNDPSPLLVVVPAEQDARDLMVGNIEPTFAESPVLRAALAADDGGRDTLFQRRFRGGSLKLVSARAPRNLRGHTARVLLLDEVDGFEISAGGEGDPVTLAERRTLSYGDRKIVMGSTPVDEATSRIVRAYERSDQRVFECACPECGALTELTWAMIEWLPDEPETAAFRCPHCEELIDERHKPGMVQDGAWRATRPDVLGHHGYRMNALISLLPNASWGKLATEFLEAKKSPETLKAFTTTLLAEPWRDLGEEIDDASLMARREQFNLSNIPPEVLVLSVGIDAQDDRLEISTVGWTRDGDALVLAHEIVWGNVLDDETWQEADDLLRRDFKHPLGGTLRIDSAIVDSGSGGHTDMVYAFCRPRIARRIMAGKGVAGFQRPAIQLSKTRAARLILVGVDTIKSQVMNRLQTGRTIRFSHDLDATYFEQLTGERRIVKYRRGAPVRAFERIPGRRVETLDCLVYAWAARQLVGLDLERRETDLSRANGPEKRPAIIRSSWMER